MSTQSTAGGGTDRVRCHLDSEGIATITFHRPEVMNALDLDDMAIFATLVEKLHERSQTDADDLRVVLITGSGREAFCAGGDLLSLADKRSAADGALLSNRMGDALRALEDLPVPIIAAINGYALGGGSEIALACDIRVASEDAKLGLVHLRLGLTPGWGAGQRLLRTVGYGRALDMLLAARAYSGTELRELGLVQHVAPPGEALPAARDIATRIAANDCDAVRAIKALLRDGLRMPYDEALAAERERFPALWEAKAHWAAVDHFLTRKQRKP